MRILFRLASGGRKLFSSNNANQSISCHQSRNIWNWRIGWLLKPMPRRGTQEFNIRRRYIFGIVLVGLAIELGLLRYFEYIAFTQEEWLEIVKKRLAKKKLDDAEEDTPMLELAEKAKQEVEVVKFPYPYWPFGNSASASRFEFSHTP